MIRRFVCAVLLLPVASGPPARSAPASSRPSSPYLDAIERAAPGVRVLAAASVEANALKVTPKFEAGAPPEVVLRAVGEVAAGGPVRLVPFKVGAAWVMAPETRETVNLNARAEDFASMPRGGIDGFLALIPAAQIGALGGAEGIAVSDLPEAARKALEAALRPPQEVVELLPGKEAPRPELPAVRRRKHDAWIREPLDWSRMRVSAHLAAYGLDWNLSGKRPAVGDYRDGTGLQWESPDGTREVSGNTLANTSFGYMADVNPALPSVPNTMKPSDLDGAAYNQPINLRRVTTAGGIVGRIAAVTGLKLSVASLFRQTPVYVGSEDLTCGEAIDGLRLALTAAWRKLGDRYVLAWDREGIAPIRQRVLDSWTPVIPDDREDPIEKIDRSPAWMNLARGLAFAKDDPLALTSQQRDAILAQYTKQSRDPDIDSMDPRPAELAWNELTPAQRAWARAEKVDKASPVWLRGKSVTRKLSAAELAKGALNGMLRVEVELITPDRGRLHVAGSEYGDLKLRRLFPQPPRPMPSLEDSEPGQQETLSELRQPLPLAVGGSLAAMAVPPLDAARLKALAVEMKAHGLKTLFYPVLFDGYATFPTDAFPLHPVLKGADGWSAAVAAMKPAGIAVVGVVSTLTWRRTGDKDHWLNAHPEWVDRDMLGRTSGDWAVAHPESQRLSSLGIAGGVDFVRPMEPVVERRLMSLIRDFAAQVGAQGIAFSHWTPSMPSLYGSPRTVLLETGPRNPLEEGFRPPSLGFAEPERLARLADGGDDPVDMLHQPSPPLMTPRAYLAFSLTNASGEDTSLADPYVPLVTRLLKAAKAARPWRTYLIYDAPGFEEFGHDRENEQMAPPVADVRIDPGLAIGPLLIPVWRRGAPEAGPAKDQAPVTRAILPFAAFSHGGLNLDKGIPVLLDFRYAPEEIPSVLKDIHPPKSVAPKPRPRPSARR